MSKFDNWLEEVHYKLLRSEGLSYSLLMHKIKLEAASDGRYVACIQLMEDGTVVMRFHGPTVEALSITAGVELMKHELLHMINGHISRRGQALRETYGSAVANVAADLVVNQFIDIELLRAEGLPGVSVDQFAFPPDLSTTEYCLLLKNKLDAEPQLDSVVGAFADSAEGGGTDDVNGSGCADGAKDGTDDAKSGGKLTPKGSWEKVTSELAKELTDLVVTELVSSVKQEALRRSDKQDLGRGWHTSDAEEFIEQVKRLPQIPWYHKLRQLEESKRNEERIPSLVRPSRRHPLHFGRVRRHALSVWVGIDVSGSMGKKQLCVIDAELRAMQQRGAEITVLQVDSELKSKVPYDRRVGVTQFKGRGGTDFSPFLAEVDKLPRHERPSFAVFYTDGYGCISNYIRDFKNRVGSDRYRQAIEGCPTRTPNGVELLWLLADNCKRPEAFRKDMPFGDIVVLPSADNETAGA